MNHIHGHLDYSSRGNDHVSHHDQGHHDTHISGRLENHGNHIDGHVKGEYHYNHDNTDVHVSGTYGSHGNYNVEAGVNIKW